MGEMRPFSPFGRWPMLRALDPFNVEDMGRLFENLGKQTAPLVSGKDGFQLPRVDVAETPAGLEVTAELPGFDQKDVSIEIDDGVLTLRAEHKEEHEKKDEKKHWHLVERSSGTFLRRFALPFEADAAKATARLDKGVLTLNVPRMASASAKPTTIPIGTS